MRTNAAYLPYVSQLKQLESSGKAIDLSCASGEWLAFMLQNGVDAQGAELDDVLLNECYRKGFAVSRKGRVDALQALRDESQILVSCFRLDASLTYQEILQIVQESLRVLKPGGLLLLETREIERLLVGEGAFYVEPASQSRDFLLPLSLPTVGKLTDYLGFARTKLFLLNADGSLAAPTADSTANGIMDDVPIVGAIAQKCASTEVLAAWDQLFSVGQSQELEQMIGKYQQTTFGHLAEQKSKILVAQTKTKQSEATVRLLSSRMQKLNAELSVVYASRSWRVTKPLRWATQAARAHLGSMKSKLRALHNASLGACLRHMLRGKRAPQGGAIAVLTPGIEEQTSVCLPLRPGARTIYLYVEHALDVRSGMIARKAVKGLSLGLKRLGERIRYVKWDSASKQCVFLDMAERQLLAESHGVPVTDEERIFYSADAGGNAPLEKHKDGEGHWLLVPEETRALDLILWARGVGLKAAFLFNDAEPLRRLNPVGDKAAAYKRYMQQLLLADVVMPLSKASEKDLLAYWVRSECADEATLPLTHVIPMAAESTLTDRVRIVADNENLILCLASTDTGAGLANVVNAYAAACRKGVARTNHWRLLVAGAWSEELRAEVERARSDGATIDFLESGDEKLDDAYRKCAFTVVPSNGAEASVLVMEGLWYGKPCICSNSGALLEYAADGGCLATDFSNGEGLASALAGLIEDAGIRQSLAEQAIRRQLVLWDGTANAIQTSIDGFAAPGANLGDVYYWIDGTVQFPESTGIQRVTRQLARGMLEAGMAMVPVKWDEGSGSIAPATAEELEFFAMWNGPAPALWSEWHPPSQNKNNNWFFMPELPINLSGEDRAKMMAVARGWGLRCAAVFYDAIPWKMRDIYPQEFSKVQYDYMEELADYDLVLPISSFSKNDLVEFLFPRVERKRNLQKRIWAVSLPGELTESRRVTYLMERAEGPIRILSVGTVEPRKNHLALLAAFEKAMQSTQTPMRLTLVGGASGIDPTLSGRVEAYIAKYKDKISWEKSPNDERLHSLYQAADFTVYPSVEEGFGLPILESLWNAKPCICANFGAMSEVLEGGGCFAVDVRNIDEMAAAIVRLASDAGLRAELSTQAVKRKFRTWRDYAEEVIARLSQVTPQQRRTVQALSQLDIGVDFSLESRPLLSICITTYNRAEWLAANLRNWVELYPDPMSGVEFLVCDNASTDETEAVVAAYMERSDFTYRRNPCNVGMLGNLRETVQYARGKYVWIIGDDDLIMPGSIERILQVIRSHHGVALVYLNYAYTRIEDARSVIDFKAFFNESTPIVPAEDDLEGKIKEICARNENFFTAIYTLVFRRDHALKAYAQNTSGRPFSSMLTCIPTTYYVLHHMMDEPGYWIGEPLIVVNMNVSWIKYAPLWILERIPEVYEIAENNGADSGEMDGWRKHTLPGVAHYFREIYTNDPLGNAAYFNPTRLVQRFMHLPEFSEYREQLMDTYSKANASGHPLAQKPITNIF